KTYATTCRKPCVGPRKCMRGWRQSSWRRRARFGSFVTRASKPRPPFAYTTGLLHRVARCCTFSGQDKSQLWEPPTIVKMELSSDPERGRCNHLVCSQYSYSPSRNLG